MPSLRRRALLQRAAAGLAAAGGSALAGCSFLDGDAAGRRTPYDVPEREDTVVPVTTTTSAVNYGPVTPPDPGTPTYRRWLPAPRALPDAGRNDPARDEDGPYDSVAFVDAGRLRELGDGVPASFDRHRWSGKLGLDYFGVGFDRVRRVVRATAEPGEVAVVEGPLDPAAVGTTLTASGYERAGDRGEYRLFARDDGPRAAAVGDAAVAWAASDPEDGDRRAALDVVRAVLKARANAVPRLHEVSDVFDRLSRIVGASPVARIPLRTTYIGGRPADEVFGGFEGIGAAHAFDAGATYRRIPLVFGRTLSPDAMEHDVRERIVGGRFARAADAVNVAVDDRTVRVTMRIGDDRYEELVGPPTGVTYPQITWGFEHADGGKTTVTVTHEAGDAVPAGTIAVTTRAGTLATFAEEYGTVAPGDSLTVSLVDGDRPVPRTIRVVWEHPDGDGRALLRTYVVPEPTP